MNKTICYIIGAGEHFYPPEKAKPGDIIIAADGGYEYLKTLNIRPDLTVGDFDSLGYIPDECSLEILPAEKDLTDTAAAIEIGWSKGYRKFFIYGGTGGRIDHTMSNIQCIADIARRGGEAYLFGSDSVITAVHNSSISFTSEAKGFVSVFSHSDLSLDVNESGLKYSLSNAVLKNTEPLGVSNEFTGKESCISVRDGTLIIVYSKDIKNIRP